MTKPTKEQIEKVAFELFNADFCAMTEADWEWRPERIKSQYRAMAQIAIIEWEKIRNSHKQGKIYSRNTGVDYNAFCAETLIRPNCSSKRYAVSRH